MASVFSTPQYSDHSNLEVAQPEPGLETAPVHNNWNNHDASQKESYYQRAWADVSEGTVPQNDEPKGRILGLSVRRFWAIVIILVVVVAAAIGGGVGGGLAAQRQTSSSSSGVASDQGANQGAGSSSTLSTSSEPAGTSTEVSSSSSPTSSESSTKTTSSASGAATSGAPTDGGCPDINGSAFTPRDAEGKTIPLGAGEPAQSFMRYCSTNWPAGARWGNPDVRDIMKVYQPSLEDCIAACASYNVGYKANAGGDMTGLCRAVTVVKKDGEFCYFKNNTGHIEFVNSNNPELFSSAVLLSSSDGGN
ncbi:hypothetical protein B0I37DRAFT_417167 [Chaetomium sp. MPI-CAGE-AT-0009]|nr:hypothetical protein B0I37DRAFT_417167 [Chaetomium sp. MPI-CAGE-AT-0009]